MNFHVDPVPFLYVLFSDNKDTFGINIHYLGAIFNKSFKPRRLNLKDTLLLFERYRKHRALFRFFEFVESPTFARIPKQFRYNILKKRWPKIMPLLYRHYKSPLIRVVWAQTKDKIDEAIADIRN
jgi:hypothetical protein